MEFLKMKYFRLKQERSRYAVRFLWGMVLPARVTNALGPTVRGALEYRNTHSCTISSVATAQDYSESKRTLRHLRLGGQNRRCVDATAMNCACRGITSAASPRFSLSFPRSPKWSEQSVGAVPEGSVPRLVDRHVDKNYP